MNNRRNSAGHRGRSRKSKVLICSSKPHEWCRRHHLLAPALISSSDHPLGYPPSPETHWRSFWRHFRGLGYFIGYHGLYSRVTAIGHFAKGDQEMIRELRWTLSSRRNNGQLGSRWWPSPSSPENQGPKWFCQCYSLFQLDSCLLKIWSKSLSIIEDSDRQGQQASPGFLKSSSISVFLILYLLFRSCPISFLRISPWSNQ